MLDPDAARDLLIDYMAERFEKMDRVYGGPRRDTYAGVLAEGHRHADAIGIPWTDDMVAARVWKVVRVAEEPR